MESVEEEEDGVSNPPSQNMNHSSRKKKRNSHVEAVEEDDTSVPHQSLRHSSRKKKKGTPNSCESEEVAAPAASSSVGSTTLPDVKRVTRNSSRMATIR